MIKIGSLAITDNLSCLPENYTGRCFLRIADSKIIWFKDGQWHREDGPAVIRKDGTVEWWEKDMCQRIRYHDGVTIHGPGRWNQ